MTFIFPQFLWALALLGVPIIIHLFNFQRPKRVLFSNTRFLRTVQEATQSTRRLKNLLVLAMRLLFTLFLVLAFAQPVLNNSQGSKQNGRQFVSLYIDNSYSMQAAQGNVQGLDMAVTNAENLVQQFPASTQFHLVTNDFDGRGQYFFSKDKILENLREVKTGNNYRSADAIAKRQQNAFATENTANREVYWFSDFQKSTLGNAEEALRLDTAAKKVLVPIQAPQAENLYIDSVWMLTPFAKAGQNNELKVKLRNSGNTAADNLPLKLFIDNRQVSSVAVSVPALGQVITTLSFTSTTGAAQRGKLTIEDLPVTFDNEYYFVINPAPAVKVAHIYGSENNNIAKVLSNRQFFDVQSFSAGNINYQSLKTADLIIIDGLADMDAGLQDALLQHQKLGRNVCIIPAARPAAGFAAQLAGLGAFAEVASDTARYTISQPDIKNPFFEGVFEALPKNTALPYAKTTLGITAGSRLLVLNNKKNFLARFQKGGKGGVYLFASALAGAGSNFALHSFFVPVMYRIAILSLHGNQRLAFSFQDAVIELDNKVDKAADKAFALTNGKTSFIPGQRVAGNKLLLEVPKTNMEAGYYNLVLDGKVAETIALNYGNRESRLEYYTPDELRNMAAGTRTTVLDAVDSSHSAAGLKQSANGNPAWKYCVVLALLFLAAEVLIIRFLK